MKRKPHFALIAMLMILAACGSSSNTATGPDELDLAIRDASDYLNDNIPQGSMIVILNIQSDSAALSDYIIDELIANAVNDRIFKVVDRQQLDLIRAEQNFQLSGEVDDNLALSIGKIFGAQTIVSGGIRQLDDRYRMTIRALEVQTAQVQGQYNRNMAAGRTINALMRSGSDSSRGTQSSTTRTTSSGNGTGTASTTNSSVVLAVTVLDGINAINVNNAATWNTAINTIRNGGNNQTYIINVTGNVSVPVPQNNENLFGSVTGLSVTIQGGGTLAISNTTGNLLRIGERQEVIAKNITLRGRSGNNNSVVRILSGGIFRMENNSLVTGNANDSSGRGGIYGGGVWVDGGSFLMQGGEVSGNTARLYGGGVYVSNGIFTMESGKISSNTTTADGPDGGGGGVYVRAGIFTMQGGTISGNRNQSYTGGGGVYVGGGGTFTMQGGIVFGNTATRTDGGGVHVYWRGTFTKTGGTINGNDASLSDRNTAAKQGHAVYWSSRPNRWRNATAGPDDNTDSYGFWMND